MKRKGTDFKYNIGQILSNENGKIKIINRYRIYGKNSARAKYYDYECLICGHIDKIYEGRLTKGHLCKKCNKKKISEERCKKKYIEVKEYINSFGIELLSEEYINNHKPLKLKCSCGNIFYRDFSTFKGTPNRKGVHVCPKCHGITINTYETVKEDLYNHDIELLDDEYENNRKKLKIRYIKCGHIIERNYVNIMRSKYECSKCKRIGFERDTEQLIKEIQESGKGEYELLSEYKTMNDKVTIKHLKCGHIWETTPHRFLDGGNRCPKCNQSKNELLIDNYLKLNNINNIPQYYYNDLYGDYAVLKFDFAILDDENNVKYLLEYDGEFHYKPIKGQHDLEKQQHRDNKKNEYCRKHNIKLIRIPYWESENIKEILDDILLNNNTDNKFIYIK